MRRSGRSNVVTWLTSKAFGVRSLAAVKPTAFRFCAVRLAMPFARLSDRLDAQNAQIVSYSNCQKYKGPAGTSSRALSIKLDQTSHCGFQKETVFLMEKPRRSSSTSFRLQRHEPMGLC